MNVPPPEVIKVSTRRVSCDGASEIRAGANYRPAALGHPRIYLEIDEHGYVDCGYCDRRFVLEGGPADGVDQAQLPDVSEGADPGHR
jgi:NADH dehydrogenase (ubiquinone) Fe-S protein 6